MEKIIAPVPRENLKTELNSEVFIRKTNNASNEIYIIDQTTAPETLKEVGRLRELTFRSAGGGTGKAMDIDHYDIMERPFKQLIVWNPRDEEIVGGYRYILCRDLEKKDGQFQSPTSRLFRISETFQEEYMPVTIELGRSFVQPEYQPLRNMRKGMYALDNLWDGLGALVIDHPDIRYFFGKITMYPHFDTLARDLILYFLDKHFPDADELVKPFDPLLPDSPVRQLETILTADNYEEDYKLLVQAVRSRNEAVPPLVNAYMGLSSTMRVFGTSVNPHFGDVEETGIMVTIADIYEHKKKRHLASYINPDRA